MPAKASSFNPTLWDTLLPVEKCQNQFDTADDTVTCVRGFSASLVTIKDVMYHSLTKVINGKMDQAYNPYGWYNLIFSVKYKYKYLFLSFCLYYHLFIHAFCHHSRKEEGHWEL